MSKRILLQKCDLSGVGQSYLKGRRGFALVLSLVLMGFLLLLLVGLSTTVWIEVHRAKQDEYSLLAQQNAKMAVLSAIGELQRTLGPDTRTSARADIVYDDDVGEYQSRWTGVWRMPSPDDPSGFPDGIDPRSKPELITWLVSGNEGLSGGSLNYRPDSLDGGSSVGTVLLLRESEAGDVSEGIVSYSAVRAPKVEIPGGAYAWWVEDEGIKYKISAVAENYNTDTRPLFPLGNSAGFFSEKFDVNFDHPRQYWDSIFNLESISNSNPDLGKLEPHVTLNGYGVIADSLRGGLRLDLSAILEMSPAEFQSSVLPILPGNRMYAEYLGDFSGGVADSGKGPDWILLRHYGALREAAGNQGIVIRPTERSAVGGTTVETVNSIGVFPIMEKFQVYITVRLSEDLTPEDTEFATFRPRLYFLPALVLWNPYDKPLVTNELLLFRWMYRDSKRAWGHNFAAGTYINNEWVEYEIDGGLFGGKEGKFPTTHSQGDSNRTEFRLRNTNSQLPLIIPPGEAIVFTMKRNAKLETGKTNVYDMEPGFRNFGFYADAEHTFRVPRSQMESGEIPAIFVDLRGRTEDASSKEELSGFEGFDFRFLMGSVTLQRMMSFRFKRDDWNSAVKGTVSRLSGNERRYGQDPNGPEPFEIPFNNLGVPSDTTPALSLGEPVPIGYEIGLQKPSPRASLHGNYEFEGVRLFASYNPRGPSNVGQWSNFTERNLLYYQMIVFENQATGQQAQQTQQIQLWDDDRSAYVGYSDGPTGSKSFSLFHLPDQGERIRSVGELRHLDLVGNNLSMHVSTESSRKRLEAGPSFVLGEARADPFIPLSSYEAVFGGQYRHVDHQWLANRQIWDRFFVSTIPWNGPITFPLENGRLIPLDDSLLNEQFVPTFNNVASKLMIDGAFNINSTSVPAWKALLAQFWGQPVVLADGTEIKAEEESSFIDLPFPQSGPYRGGGTSTPELYGGYRQLAEAEIDALAREIVKLIKERGPFVSLADFINRSIRPEDGIWGDKDPPPNQSLSALADDPRLFGLLQAAIEKAGLNDDLGPSSSDYVTTNVPPWNGGGITSNERNLHVLPAAVGPFMEGAPGYLTQGKLLQRLGPVLSARSDTYRIRAYGEVRNPLNNEVEAQAYAEVIVQRLPEYVDPADSPETPVNELTQAINREFGRRFVISSFRWLNPNEL